MLSTSQAFFLALLTLTAVIPDARSSVSDTFDAIVETADVNEGKTLEMWCGAKESNEEAVICTWRSPDGRSFFVAGGTVYEPATGQIVSGMNSFGRQQGSCDLFVQQVNASQMGTWSCRMSQQGGGGVFHEAFLSALPAGERVKEGLRLPNSWKPDNYDIRIVTNFEPEFTFDGKVTATLKSNVAADKIVLHAKAMTIYEDSITVRDENGERIRISGFGYDDARNFVILYLDSSVSAEATVTVDIDYQGILNDELAGYYRSSYARKDGTTGYLGITQFEATDARKAFPCLDEPAMKAVFKLSLGRPQTYWSASNMPIRKAGLPLNPPRQGYVMDEFAPSRKMSTYLVAFMVSDFTFRASYTDDRREFRIWARDSLYDQTAFAAEIGPKVLDYYEEYFGVPFPLPKQDMAAIPDFNAGAMENWGLVTYREADILYEDGVSSLENRNRIAEVVSHELAHQWFGNLVTMEWWSDLWLNEGFATYVEFIGQKVSDPESGPMDRFVLACNQYAFGLDATAASHPISVEVVDPLDIGLLFDAISYQKGGSIIRMLEYIITTDTFNRGVHNYLVEYSYGNAVQDDLWEKLTEVAREDDTLPAGLTVKSIMDSWTKQMGYPVVTVRRGDDPGTVVVSQERFVIGLNQSDDASSPYRWWVPLTYTRVPGGDFLDANSRGFLRPDEDELEVAVEGDGAVIFNILETGYYRVNYDQENWEALAEAIGKDVNAVHKINRAQILDDALNLAKGNLLNYETALDMTTYLDKEDDYLPWSAATTALAYVRLMLQGNDTQNGQLEAYIGSRMVHIYDALDGQDSATDSYFDSLLRAMSADYMCGFGYSPCVGKATGQFRQWMQSEKPDVAGSNPIGETVRLTYYCTAISEGGDEEWNFLSERYLNTENSIERRNIMSALGCSGDRDTLSKYLMTVVAEDSPVRKQDGVYVVNGVVGGSTLGVEVAWDWLTDNWDLIRQVQDVGLQSPVPDMVTSITSSFNSEEELSELKDFVSLNSDNLGSSEQAFQAAIESTEFNMAWMTKHADTIAKWLQRQQQQS